MPEEERKTGTESEALPTDGLAGFVVSLLDELKAEDIVVLRMDEVLPITDYFVIATGGNRRHVESLREVIQKRLKERKWLPINRSGRETGTWVLLDYGPIVVHLFQPKEREYYDLEMLWADAKSVPLEELRVAE
jgi:ribosome-associated protein